MSHLKYTKLSPFAYDLFKASPSSVGFDLRAVENVRIDPHSVTCVSTGISIEPPEGTYVRLASRSSLALLGISVEGGVIDPDYRGEIKVIMLNHTKTPVEFEKGMRIAQLIPEKASWPEVVQVVSLDTTERGDKGFGSSGKF